VQHVRGTGLRHPQVGVDVIYIRRHLPQRTRVYRKQDDYQKDCDSDAAYAYEQAGDVREKVTPGD
jgi:hypothetical protein